METKMEEKIGNLIQEADWKKEKHVPVIECPDEVSKDEMFDVKAGLGKEIAHPNTTEHHIRWIELYFHPATAGTYQRSPDLAGTYPGEAQRQRFQSAYGVRPAAHRRAALR